MVSLRPFSLRNRNVLVAVVALVVLQVFATLVSGVAARDSSIAAAREGISREGATTAEAVLRHLEPASQSVSISQRLLERDLIDRSSPGLEQYLFTQLAVMPQMTGSFVGYPNGDFVFVATDGDGYVTKRISAEPVRKVVINRYDEMFELSSTEEVFDDDYDPTIRPWYEAALESDATIWTDPYVFFSSGAPGVTASAAARVDGEVVAVFGVDVMLSGLSTFLDELDISDEGEAFVVSGDQIVGAPSYYGESIGQDPDGEARLLTVDELEVPQFEEALQSDVQEVDTPHGTDLVLYVELPAADGIEWSVVVRAPEASFTAISDAQQRTTLLITLGGGLVIFFGILALVRVSRPIEQVQAWASTDSLTGLANRRRIDEQGAAMLAQLGADEVLSVMLLDLDGFKGLNDQHGHHAGDRALATVGRLLTERTDVDDLVGRLGGDEFVIVRRECSRAAAIDGANNLMDDLRGALVSEFSAAPLGVSAGLTATDDFSGDFPALMMEADTALIDAKTDYKGMLRLSDHLVASSI